jgi:hypothetical protein
MKYFSALFFALSLIWTWNVIHSETVVSFETHSGIQDQMTQFLINSVKSQRSDALNIKVEKIWTEMLLKNKVKVHFVYSFETPEANNKAPSLTRISGEGILERKEDDGTGYDKWNLSEVKTNSDSLIFEEAEIISADPVK